MVPALMKMQCLDLLNVFFFTDKMRTLVLFGILCIAFVLGDKDNYKKYHSSSNYLSGSTSKKYLGGSNYYKNQYQNSYYPSRGQSGLYGNDYNDRLGHGCK